MELNLKSDLRNLRNLTSFFHLFLFFHSFLSSFKIFRDEFGVMNFFGSFGMCFVGGYVPKALASSTLRLFLRFSAASTLSCVSCSCE